MAPTLPPILLSSLSQLVAAHTGLHFPKERWRDLERGIAAAASDFGFSDVEACAYKLVSAPLARHQIESLASHLTVGETYFFREKNSLDALEQRIFPALLQNINNTTRPLRIWSAGCCTGEEPYSIAMLLDRLIPQPQQSDITILATDINPQFLRKAAQGVYGEWSLRNTPAWIKDRYFKRSRNAHFEIQPFIRKRVAFSYLNLAEDVYPSLINNTNAMDMILCRNVLMYFTPEGAKKVVEGFSRSLVEGGWLIVSPTETSNTLFSRFTAVEFPGAVLYRKITSAKTQVAASGYSAQAISLEAERPIVPELATMFTEPMTVDSTERASLEAVLLEPEPAAPSLLQEAPHKVSALMARDCANQGRLVEAADWCEKAISADKLNPAYYYLYATIQQELGQSSIATRSLLHTIYLDPDFVLAHFTLGNLCLSQGQQREAERHFDNTQTLLRLYAQDDMLPEAEGLTAGRLGEIVASVRSSLPRAAALRA